MNVDQIFEIDATIAKTVQNRWNLEKVDNHSKVYFLIDLSSSPYNQIVPPFDDLLCLFVQCTYERNVHMWSKVWESWRYKQLCEDSVIGCFSSIYHGVSCKKILECDVDFYFLLVFSPWFNHGEQNTHFWTGHISINISSHVHNEDDYESQ